MKSAQRFLTTLTTLSLIFLTSAAAVAAPAGTHDAAATATAPALMQPEQLAKIVTSKESAKPLMFQVGFHVLFLQAHIPGSEYTGAASTDPGLRQLRQRVEKLPRSQFIVLYCGCCPWNRCPNVHPAYDALRAMGFTNVKLLFIDDNFGTNWVDHGYPVAKGE